jgi:crotonobetainyl-CoA:carnitine CoA-transferase CaiB-like acyl-CoA transferase
MAALLARRRTGRGTDVDVSAVEAGVELVGPLLLDVAVNQRGTRRPDFPTGNRLTDPAAAPHGVYPCTGADRWVAIAVFDDAEWAALVDAMGEPEWARDARFATLASRLEHQDALDAHLAEWTGERDRFEVMHLLQAHGICAGAVQDAEDVNEHDPQMAHRQVFFELDHPVIGEARFEGLPFTSTSFEADHWRSGPLLGEDNAHVATELLGLEPGEYEALVAEGVM